MAKITIFNVSENLDYINVGEVLTLRKNPNDNLDPAKIEAFVGQKMIGYVGANMNAIVPGCVTNKDIYDTVPDEFQGVVVSNNKRINNVTSKIVLEVEISGVSGASTTATAGVKIFTFYVAGSAGKYPGKSEVVNEIDKGGKVYLQLEKVVNAKGESDIICHRTVNGNKVLCGVFKKEHFGQQGYSSKDDFEVVAAILDTEELEGYVTGRGPTSFDLQISIADSELNKFKNVATKKAVGGVKANLVTQGYDEAVLDEIEDYLASNKFSATEIQTIFKSYKQYDPAVSFRIRKPKTLYNDSFESLKICYAAFLNGFHLLLSGDKGTGKNCLIATWAWILQRPLYSISINRETDKLDMLGSKTIETEIDANTGRAIDKIAFSPEVLLEAMDIGGIINIDEINFADAGITGLLHSICDDRREIEVPGYKKVVSDENFFVMATMNVDYQGTNELNEALSDRFIDIRFPSNESIASILSSNCPKTPMSEIQIADSIYRQMYNIIQNRDSSLDSNCLTVRGFIQALNMSPVLGLKKALSVCVADKIKDEEYSNNVKTIIDSKCK